MVLRDWAGILETGHKQLDAQQEAVIALADEVERLCACCELRDEVASGIETMRSGMAAYFAYKDSLMSLLPFGWYSGMIAAHTASHAMMLGAMDQLAQAVRQNMPPISVAGEFSRLMTRMLADLIAKDSALVGALMREGHLQPTGTPIPPPIG